MRLTIGICIGAWSLVSNNVLAFAPRCPTFLKKNHVMFSVVEENAAASSSETSLNDNPLLAAVKQMDATLVSTILEENDEVMDEATTEAAFWAVVEAVKQSEAQDKPLSADVPRMLHHIFDADMHHLIARNDKLTTNVTCMQPRDTGLSSHEQMSYIFDDSSAKDLPLKEGRRCEDGRCNCDACSRNIFPTFASDAETSLEKFPELASFTFNNLANVSTETILQFTRLIERVRRSIAHEYGLPLSYILPLQAYSRKYVAGTTQQGGGGGEGDFVTLHTDEATHAGYHYSCVLYLSTQGEDFEGGDFVFNDPLDDEQQDEQQDAAMSSDQDDDIDEEDEEAAAQALFEKLMRGEELPDDGEGDTVVSTTELIDNHWGDDDPEEYEDLEYYNMMKERIRRSGRKLTPYHPSRGAAVIFSSGWENMHEVEKITSGIRYAVPCFFTTSPVPEIAYEQMVQGKPKTDEDIADDWLHLLLSHREETPEEGVGRVKELLMKWHHICTPLSMH